MISPNMNAVEHIARFIRVLDEYGIAASPVLEIVDAVGIANVFLGAGTLSGCLQLLIPAYPDALAIVAPGATLPERSMLLLSLHAGAPISAAVVIGGATTPQSSVEEVAPAAARSLWLPIVETLASSADNTIKNRTRHLGAERGTISISFFERSDAGQGALGDALAALAIRLGVPASWRLAFDYVGPKADMSVTTECLSTGPAPRIALRFGRATWDQVIDLAKATYGVDLARNAAVRMGMLAATLGIDDLRGVETVFDQAAPDLINLAQARLT